ncbi:MAG: sigma-70 family RNA polymerase sigma factor [Thermoanaerobaculia bacterium]
MRQNDPPDKDQAPEITRLLERWGAGERNAFEELFPVLYPELKRLAGRQLRGERSGHTLQTTALVHEAFLELVGQKRARFESRSHFLAVAAFVMRRILAEHARSRAALKRGGGLPAIDLGDRIGEIAIDDAGCEEIAAVDEALDRFSAIDERAAKVVVMRYFGGLSHEEIAAALGLSAVTVKRDWAVAKAWLRRELAAP